MEARNFLSLLCGLLLHRSLAHFPSKEFARPVKETTQNILEIPTVQVIALGIPHVWIVERIQEQIVVIIKVGPQERVQQRTVEQIGDVPVPQIQEQIEEVVRVIP